MTRLAALHEASGDPRAAVELLAPLVADDPADEVVQRALIRGYALSGDRGAALRQYQTLVAALRDGLAVHPDTQTEQIYRQVMAGQLSGSAPAAAARPPRRRSLVPPYLPKRLRVPEHRTAARRGHEPAITCPSG